MQTHFTDEFRKSQRLSETFLERFWAKVNKTETCWIWIGAQRSKGKYGAIMRGRTIDGLIRSNIASWVIHNGAIPEGLCVLHKCPGGSNSMCVNPDHLYLGTHKQNGMDRVLEGRSASGDRHGMSVLTNGDVLKIRDIYDFGKSKAQIGRDFGVNESTIGRIVNRKTWKHI